MTGSYRSMSFAELSGAYDRLAPEARVVRPIVDVPDDPHPDRVGHGIFLATMGPDVVSTSTCLVPVASMPVWDVNGYYRTLGIGWPYRPTKGELGRAYQARHGDRSDYATYALLQLLDPETRARYDARPLGPPMDDRYRWEELLRLASAWAAAQSLASGERVTPKDFFGGLDPSQVEELVDTDRQGAAGADAGERRSGREPEFAWPYAYYHWGSRKRDDRVLARWQELLVTAFSRQALVIPLAVGYVGDIPGEAVRVRYRRQGIPDLIEILFLHEDSLPTRGLAESVVATYYRQPYLSILSPLSIPEPS